MLGHKASLNKFKKSEIVSNIFFNLIGMKLEINCKKITGNFTNMWRLNNMLLNNQLVKKKSKEKNYTETNGNGNTAYQCDAAKAVLREFHSNKFLC